MLVSRRRFLFSFRLCADVRYPSFVSEALFLFCLLTLTVFPSFLFVSVVQARSFFLPLFIAAMHVEFRLSELAHACAFDTESFYRVKQLMAAAGAPRGSGYTHNHNPTSSLVPSAITGSSSGAQSIPRERSLLTINTGKRRDIDDENGRVAQLRVQLVLERLVKLESDSLVARRERVQHEKQIESNWDGSEVRTHRYEVKPGEIILSSLPASVADCVMKIRLLQLPPRLRDAGETRRVQQAIGPVTSPELQWDAPLCIGVAKVTLKEVLMVRGGVCIALQAKQSMIRLVEELNLNTIATNGMLGKDLGGSAFLTFQAVSYAFGRVQPSRLLMYRSKQRPALTSTADGERASEDPGSVSRQTSSHAFGALGSRDRFSTSPDPYGATNYHLDSGTNTTNYGGGASSPRQRQTAGESAIGNLDTPSMRFVLVPYMAIVDSVLRVSDAVSWRRPGKTLLLLSLLVLLLAADMLDVALVLVSVVLLAMVLQTTSVFYRIPLADRTTGAMVSPELPLGTASAQTFLYGRHQALLNSLVRARLFFIHGLQEDCYYEVALIFHMLRRMQRPLSMLTVGLCVSLCFLSMETLIVFGLCAAFFVYPISLRLPTLRQRKAQPASLLALVHALRQALELNRPMRVVRVVKVAMMTPPPEPAHLPLAATRNLPLTPAAENAQLAFLSSIEKAAAEATVKSPVFSGTARSVSSSKEREASVYSHQRARTMDGETFSPGFAMTHRQQQQNASHLSFAVIVFTCDGGSGPGGLSSTSTFSASTTTRGVSSQMLANRLRKQLELANHLHDLSGTLTSSPPANLAATSSAKNHGSTQTDTARTLSTNSMYDLFDKYFAETLKLLGLIRRSCSMQTYLSPASAQQLHGVTLDQVPLNLFVQAPWLRVEGKDDGITATLMEMPHNSLRLSKLPPTAGADNEARTLALLAVNLLQGMRLSLYCADAKSSICSMIVPLQPSSAQIKRVADPNPCPSALYTALEEVWRGSTTSGADKDGEWTFSPDWVLQMVSARKDCWKTTTGSALQRPEVSMTADDSQFFHDSPSRHNTLFHTFTQTPSSRPQPAATVQQPNSALLSPRVPSNAFSATYGALPPASSGTNDPGRSGTFSATRRASSHEVPRQGMSSREWGSTAPASPVRDPNRHPPLRNSFILPPAAAGAGDSSSRGEGESAKDARQDTSITVEPPELQQTQNARS